MIITLGRQIKNARNQYTMSQTDLATKVSAKLGREVSIEVISDIENDYYCDVDLIPFLASVFFDANEAWFYDLHKQTYPKL